MEADFPLEPGTPPVDRSPYRANPRVQEVIDQCVNQMEKDGIIEQRPSPWGSAVTIVAKSDGSPRLCVDYRSTINKSLVRKSWPMPDMEALIDTVAGAKFISVCDVQSAYHQIPVAEAEQDKTAFVTQKGKWVFKRLPFGIANAPFLFPRMMSLAFSHFGPKSGLPVYMDDCICCSSTWEGHLTLLENNFQSDTSSRSHPQTIQSSTRTQRSQILRSYTIIRWYSNWWWPHQSYHWFTKTHWYQATDISVRHGKLRKKNYFQFSSNNSSFGSSNKEKSDWRS